jgi:hypothetical protein
MGFETLGDWQQAAHRQNQGQEPKSSTSRRLSTDPVLRHRSLGGPYICNSSWHRAYRVVKCGWDKCNNRSLAQKPTHERTLPTPRRYLRLYECATYAYATMVCAQLNAVLRLWLLHPGLTECRAGLVAQLVFSGLE